VLTHLMIATTLLAGIPSNLDDYLARAIERGVPLFNAGNPGACAAVYATALEGVVANAGWRIQAEEQDNLADWLQMSAAIADPSERAWAYRGLIDRLLSNEPIPAVELADTVTLFDFSDPNDIEPWRVVLDGVMGGLSTGEVDVENGRLIFSGETSLRNNGGFSSIRARVPAGSLAGYRALRIQVEGDGRTYILGASSQAGRGDSYWHRFETTAGEAITVTVPITEMIRQYFGNPIRGRLQPSQVAGLEFYIYDKKAGPFRLEVDRIEAVR